MVFLLELAETPDDFEARSKVLIHGFHLQVYGDAEETIAVSSHVAGLHAAQATNVMPILIIIATI